MCRKNITFLANNPLLLPPGFQLFINCVDRGTLISIYSDTGSLQVPSDALISFRSCQVATINDAQLQAEEVAPTNIGAAFFGLDGEIRFEDCHILFPLAVCTKLLTACSNCTCSEQALQKHANVGWPDGPGKTRQELACNYNLFLCHCLCFYAGRTSAVGISEPVTRLLLRTHRSPAIHAAMLTIQLSLLTQVRLESH